MRELAPNIYVETSYARITVGAILTRDGWVCIDAPPYPHEARAWIAALAAIDSRPIRYLILTDHQRDRVVGSGHFSAPVVTHEFSARQIFNLKSTYLAQAAEELSQTDRNFMDLAGLKVAVPHISYSESFILNLTGRRIKLVSQPSATTGNTWVILPKEKIIFGGESLVLDRHPHLDMGDTLAWLALLRMLRLGRYDKWMLIPGRDKPLTDMDKTESLSEYLRVARRRVKSLCRSGGTRQELGELVPELLAYFPYSPDHQEEIIRRIKLGLEAIYGEMTVSDGDDKESE